MVKFKSFGVRIRYWDPRSPLGAGMGVQKKFQLGIGAGTGIINYFGDWGQGYQSLAPPRPIAIPTKEFDPLY